MIISYTYRNETKTVSFDGKNTKGGFRFQHGVLATHQITPNKIIIKARGPVDIVITEEKTANDEAPVKVETKNISLIQISTFGAVALSVTELSEKLNCVIKANIIAINTELKTTGIVKLDARYSDESTITFSQHCQIYALLLYVNQLSVYKEVQASFAYACIREFKSCNESFRIGSTLPFSFKNESKIITKEAAEFFNKHRSLVAIDAFSGIVNIDLTSVQFQFRGLPEVGKITARNSTIFYTGDIDLEDTNSVASSVSISDDVEQGAISSASTTMAIQTRNVQFDLILFPELDLCLVDSNLTAVEPTIKSSVEIRGTLRLIASDVFLPCPLILAENSKTELFESSICANNVQVKGNVTYLKNNPIDKADKREPISRVVSSNERVEFKLEDKVEGVVDHFTSSKITSHRWLHERLLSLTESVVGEQQNRFFLKQQRDFYKALIFSLLFEGVSNNKRQEILDVIAAPYVELVDKELNDLFANSEIDDHYHAMKEIIEDKKRLITKFIDEYLGLSEAVSIVRFFQKYDDLQDGDNDPIHIMALQISVEIANSSKQKVTYETINKFLSGKGISSVFSGNGYEYKDIIKNPIASVAIEALLQDKVFYWRTKVNLNKIFDIELSALAVPLEYDENANALIEFFAVMCYQLPGLLERLTPALITRRMPTFITRINDKMNDLFGDHQHEAENNGTIVVHESAVMSGNNGQLHASGYLLINKDVEVDGLKLVARGIDVAAKINVNGKKYLDIRALMVAKILGYACSNNTSIVADHVLERTERILPEKFSFSLDRNSFQRKISGIAGYERLRIQALTHVNHSAVLTSANLSISALVDLNLGVIFAFNCHRNYAVGVDGFATFYRPSAVADIVNRDKLITLFKMGVAYISPEITFAFQTVSRFMAMKETGGQIFSLLDKALTQGISKMSRLELANFVLTCKRGVSDVYGAYNMLPDLGKTALANVKINDDDIKYTYTPDGMVFTYSKDYIERREAALQKDREASSAARGERWVNFSVSNTAKQLGKEAFTIAAPLHHTDAILQAQFAGVALVPGTLSSQNLARYDMAGSSTSINFANQSLFTHWISPYSMHYADNYRSRAGISYINYGEVHANEFNISGGNYYEYGQVDAPRKIFDVKNGYIAPTAKVSRMEGNVGVFSGDLTIEGSLEFADSVVAVGGKLVFSGKPKVSSNAVFAAGDIDITCEWNYGGTLFFEATNSFNARSTSLFNAQDGSIIGVHANNGDFLCRGRHNLAFLRFDDMSVEQARDLAYQLNGYVQLDTTYASGIRVTTQRTENVMVLNGRPHRANAELVTRGGAYLHPTGYRRAADDVFIDYNTALQVIRDFETYYAEADNSVPRRNRMFQYTAEALGVTSTALTTGGVALLNPVLFGSGLIVGAIAGAIDSLSSRRRRRADERRQRAEERRQNAIAEVERRLLKIQQDSAELSITEAEFYSSAQNIASGKSRLRDASAASNIYAQQRSDLQLAFTNERYKLDQQHQNDLATLAKIHERNRNAIKYAPGVTIGVGVAANMGTTGTTLSMTATTGPRAQPITNRMPIASIDANRIPAAVRRTEQRRVPARIPEQGSTMELDVTNTVVINDISRRNNTRPEAFNDGTQNLEILQQTDDDRTMLFSRQLNGTSSRNILDDTGYLTGSGFRNGRPVFGDDQQPHSTSNALVPQIPYREVLTVKSNFIRNLERQTGIRFSDADRTYIRQQLNVTRDGNGYVVSLRNGVLDFGDFKIVRNMQLSPNTTVRMYLSNADFVVINSRSGIYRPLQDVSLLQRLMRMFSSQNSSSAAQWGSRIGRLGNVILFALMPAPIHDDTDHDLSRFITDPRWVEVGRVNGEGMDPPRLPNTFTTPALQPGRRDNIPPTRARQVSREDAIVSRYGSEHARMSVDTGRMITPAYSGHREDGLMFRGDIKRFLCSNGLVYEDAPYHGNHDNNIKNKKPKDPKMAMESSKVFRESGTKQRRLAYDPVNDEIVVLDGRTDQSFHGHVRSWDELGNEQKAFMKKEFGFHHKGRPPKLVE